MYLRRGSPPELILKSLRVNYILVRRLCAKESALPRAEIARSERVIPIWRRGRLHCGAKTRARLPRNQKPRSSVAGIRKVTANAVLRELQEPLVRDADSSSIHDKSLSRENIGS